MPWKKRVRWQEFSQDGTFVGDKSMVIKARERGNGRTKYKRRKYLVTR